MQDLALPEDEEAARYVDNFERLRDPSHRCGYSDSQWVAMLEEAELMVEHKEQFIKHHKFLRWAERQGCTPEVMENLARLTDRAPEEVVDWMQPMHFGTPTSRFVNRHIIIAGSKGRGIHRGGVGAVPRLRRQTEACRWAFAPIETWGR